MLFYTLQYRQVWEHMLQTIQMISAQRSQAIANVYPTPNSLHSAFKSRRSTDIFLSRTEADWQEQLIKEFAEKTKLHKKLAHSIYKIFTSLDPNESVP